MDLIYQQNFLFITFSQEYFFLRLSASNVIDWSLKLSSTLSFTIKWVSKSFLLIFLLQIQINVAKNKSSTKSETLTKLFVSFFKFAIITFDYFHL